MPAIYHEGSWLGNATDPEVLVKDTVGWTGKNLLKINMLQSPYTRNGITFIKNSDGSISVSGTSTYVTAINIAYFDVESNVKYILTGTPDDIVNPTNNYIRAHREQDTYIWQVQDNGNGAVIQRTNSERIWIDIRIASGVTINTTFYPMLRKADITDPTYEPYHESVEEEIEQIYAGNGVLGAKNLLPISLSTRTENGVTVTVNKDSNGNVLSVVLNGTSTSSGQFNLNNTPELLNSLLRKYGDLIWSGCPSRTDCRMYTHISGGSYVTLTNNEEKILSASNNYDASILVQYDNGVTYNNVTFYPMLRLASDPDDTYQPYAMTNRELTEKKINIADLKTVVSASSDFADFKTRIASL